MVKKERKAIRKPTLFEAISCFIVMAIVIGVGKGIFKLDIQPLLLLCAFYAAIIGLRLGYTYQEMEQGVTENFTASLPVIYILIAVGIVIGTWIYSGTVPYMIYLGLQLISPQMFLVTAWAITAIVSTATGTAWGSVATAGLALMGVANEMGIPLGMAAGAVIAGGVFGDKMSPLSDTTNLAPMICKVDLFDHIRHMFWTTIPASLVGLAVWFVVGQGLTVNAENAASIAVLSENLSSIFNWNILLLLPPVIVIAGAMMRKPTVPIMLLSSVVAIALGMGFHGFSFAAGVSSCVGGFKVSMVTAAGAADAIAAENVVKLLTRGGISSMMTIVNTIICAYAFAGIVAKIGCLEVILNSLASKVDCRWKLIGVTVCAGILLTFATGVASVPIIMIGFLMSDMYKDMGLHGVNLSRTLEDCGTMLIPFVPWGASGIYYMDLLGVTVTEYAIWCVPCYLCVVFAMIWAVSGKGIRYLNK